MKEALVYKKVLSILKSFKGKISKIVVFLIISVIVSMRIPLFTRTLFDEGFLKLDYQIVIKYSIIIFVMFLINVFINVINQKTRAKIKVGVKKNLYGIAFDKLFKIKIRYFKDKNKNEIINMICTDIDNISQVADQSTFFIIEQVFMMIGGAIGLILISPQLSLIVLIYFPFKLILTKYLAKKNKKLNEKHINKYGMFSHWFDDTLAGINEIKMFNLKKDKSERLMENIDEINKIEERVTILDTLNSSSEVILTQALNMLIYIIGAGFVITSKMTLGSVIAFITYSIYVVRPLSVIINLSYLMSHIIPSAKRFFEFLECEEECDNGTISASNSVRSIEFKNVGFSYDAKSKVFENFSMKLLPKDKIAIVGDNGTGKSTLINILLRLYDPDYGDILLNDKNIENYTLDTYRDLFSVIAQDAYIFNDTIENNIKLANATDLQQYDSILKSLNLFEIVKLYSDEDYSVGQNGMLLSGGQRQKIAIARAIVRNNPIFIFDEATSNIDAETENMFIKLLKSAFSEKIVLLITHKKKLLEQMDTIVFFSNGKITSIGTHQELLTSCCFYNDFINQYVRAQ